MELLVWKLFFWIGILGGMISSSAALYGRYYVLPAWLTGPHVCKLEAGGCQVLFRTPNAALLGPPNALLGIMFYAILAASLHWTWPWFLLWLGSSFSMAVSLYLAIHLLRNHLECRICWLGHGSNLILWGTLTWGWLATSFGLP